MGLRLWTRFTSVKTNIGLQSDSPVLNPVLSIELLSWSCDSCVVRWDWDEACTSSMNHWSATGDAAQYINCSAAGMTLYISVKNIVQSPECCSAAVCRPMCVCLPLQPGRDTDDSVVFASKRLCSHCSLSCPVDCRVLSWTIINVVGLFLRPRLNFGARSHW